MKQALRYRFLSIPNKMHGDVRILIDTNKSPEYIMEKDEMLNCGITLFPLINFMIVKPDSIDENGNRIRAQWDPGDSITLSRYNLPIFVNELKEIYNSLKRPNLYTYTKDRLEVNDKIAEECRRVFMLSNTAIELSTVVIKEVTDLGEKYLEGVKLKFNNESHVVLLTINELISIIYTIDHTDINVLGFELYKAYLKGKTIEPKVAQKPAIDIEPK